MRGKGSFNKSMVIILFIFLMLVLMAFTRFSWKTTEILVNSKDIYNGTAQGELFSPFNLQIQPMERLLLVNFDQDEIYIGFEPQVFDDKVHGSGLLVIAWRVDGFVDIYHQPSLTLDPELYSITGKGLADMLERPLNDARFEVKDSGVDAYFAFEDKLGRQIEFEILESSRKKRKPFSLLAPMGMSAQNPSALPLIMLEDFYFVRKANTMVNILIAGEKYKPESLPVPIDGSSMYFLRYSDKPLIATFNSAYDGTLAQLDIISNNKARGNDVEYDLVKNEGQLEIRRMYMPVKDREIQVEFNPAIPNIVNIVDNIQLKGKFIISSDPTMGKVSGEYLIERHDNKVTLKLIPSDGWQPNESKLTVRLIYLVNSDFKNWPKTYQWDATIDLNSSGQVNMVSGWKREP